MTRNTDHTPRWRTSSHSGATDNCVQVAADWRTSSHSGGGNDCVQVAADWRTSSHSGGGNNCIQVAGSGSSSVVVRDSKDPDGPVLAFTAAEWEMFTRTVKAGVFDVA